MKNSYGEPEVAGRNVVYRIKDDLYYSVNVEEWNGKEWIKYQVWFRLSCDDQADDLQIEFVMLDPYVRKNLTYVGDQEDADYFTVSIRCGFEVDH